MLKFYIFYSQFIIKNMQEVTSKKESKDHCSCLICVIKMKKLTKKWLPCPTRPITKPFSIACYFFKDLPQITKRNENQALTREKLNLVKHQLTISAYVDCKKKKSLSLQVLRRIQLCYLWNPGKGNYFSYSTSTGPCVFRTHR